ncbi:MAG: hypothetical protein M1816_007805 [Peltula sp. TS41687]|nr:MAG: hypothetical protein M1816_007805 [Peltula sp. TS41687]
MAPPSTSSSAATTAANTPSPTNQKRPFPSSAAKPARKLAKTFHGNNEKKNDSLAARIGQEIHDEDDGERVDTLLEFARLELKEREDEIRILEE